ncbi:MAG: NADH-quinone oxidoreductase subunit NuoK [Methanomassiliicoccaceae archaeon]|nr:NADH-quinone oxidoreductase subunit NuoK [Methanomassiliicoccaceae archaeon]
MKMIPIEFFLILSAALFCVGIAGVLTKTNGIVILMCIELMLNAANINFIAFASFLNDALGQMFVLMTISVAAAEVGVGIAILLHAYKSKKTTDVDDLTVMRW